MGQVIDFNEKMETRIFRGACQQIEAKLRTPQPKTYDDLRCDEQCKILRASLSLLRWANRMKSGEIIKPSELERLANEIIGHNEKLVEIFRELRKKHGNPVAFYKFI